MSTVQNATISGLYALLEYKLWSASAALFFNGICLILFGFAIFYLQKAKTRASRLFLILSGVLVLFALAQVVLDVTLAVIFLQVTQTLVDGGSVGHVLSMYQTWVHIGEASEVLLAVNNAITDSVLLYRCAVIWGSSRYSRIVIAFPLLLILSTLVVSLWEIFGIDTPTPIPFSLALVTNFFLLGLTAGRIWIKGRQATVVLGVQAGRRYNRTLEIICESSLLYFVTVLVYLIASVTKPLGPVTGVAWGALAQLVNIVPMMIMVRVGIARNTGEQEGNLRTFYGGNAGSFTMSTLLKSSA